MREKENFFLITANRLKSTYIIKLLIIPFLLLFLSSNVYNLTVFGQRQNSNVPNDDINIVAVGDFYCNDETEDTIENIYQY